MNDFQFICPYSPLSGEINFSFPDTDCLSDSVLLNPISFSCEELSVYLLNEILLPLNFYDGATSETTWNDFLTLDISVGELNTSTWNDFLSLDFYSGSTSEVIISDTFKFDFYSGSTSEVIISDTFDFFEGNSTVFLVSLFRPVDFQFPCEYLVPYGEVNFKFPDDECSSFYETVTGSSLELDLSILSVLNFDVLEGTICQIDLKTDRKNNLTCLLIPFEVATLGVTGDPLTIAQMGLGVTCQSLSFYSDEAVEFDFILSEKVAIELSSVNETGELADFSLTTDKTAFLELEIKTGESFAFNLYNVNRGGSNLEVIDIVDSRRKISFSLTVNNKKITSEFHIDSISFSRANVSVKNVKFKKQTISMFCEVIKRTIQPISVKIYGYK